MTAHLIQLAIGPVQEFIAAARRTRDLWFGSHLLSEISKATAKAVRDHGGNLIFPAPERSADLEPDSEFNVANIIVAEIHNHNPETLARSAKEAAIARWRSFADPVYEDVRKALRDDDTWENQVNDVVEFYAAWVPYTRANYCECRRRLTKLIAGRKQCRNFLSGHGLPMVPKSSLDGLRETVLSENRKKWPPELRYGLRVREGEQLDVIGLVKRRALGVQRFASVSRIACDPWIRGIARKQGGEVLKRVAQLCGGAARRLVNDLDTDHLHADYKLFPYEGSVMYRQRHHELVEEISDKDDTEAREAAMRLAEQISDELEGLGGEPDPYIAVIVADGDHMGRTIDAIAALPRDDHPKPHCDFSRELARFAGRARQIVRECHGLLIYSGGDDVLAFVPVDQALLCARALHEAFSQTMKGALKDTSIGLPTLSVGVAIGHFLEHLEDLLDFGRVAEKDAKKPDRNGLAVHLHKRGGVPVKVRQRWEDRLDLRLGTAAQWFNAKAISNRTPYELHRLASVYDDWPAATVGAAIRADAARIIDRKRPPGTDDQMHQIKERLASVKHADNLRGLANELLIARQLTVALRQSGGQSQ